MSVKVSPVVVLLTCLLVDVVASAPVGAVEGKFGVIRRAPAASCSAAYSARMITGAWHQREFVMISSRTIFLKTGIDCAHFASLGRLFHGSTARTQKTPFLCRFSQARRAGLLYSKLVLKLTLFGTKQGKR